MKSRYLLALVPCLALGGLLLGVHAVGCEAQPFYDAEEGLLTCDWESQGHDLMCILKEGTHCDRELKMCKCPAGEDFCRQRTPFGECEGTARCRPSAECQPQCATPSDCVQPPDPRCGAATCSNGVCGAPQCPSGGTPCSDCVAQSCCSQLQSCIASPSCLTAVACVTQCIQGGGSFFQCAIQCQVFGNQPALQLLGCIGQNCNGQCP